MARGVNKVTIIGNLGADPESRTLPSGGAVCNISIATTETWRNRENGEQQEHTEWHRVVFFGKLAEIAAEYLHKGSQVYIEGRLRTNKWQDKEGHDRYSTQIVANEMQMLGRREAGASSETPATETAGAQSDTGSGEDADFEDSIPF